MLLGSGIKNELKKSDILYQRSIPEVYKGGSRMEFRQLEAFSAVVEENSFSKAAQRLCVTQPTISNHIHALEKELNTKLIIRTTKSIAVTNEGLLLYEYARSILHIRQRTYQKFSNLGKNSIELGASTIPSAYILPEILAEYRNKYPQIFFNILQSDSLDIINKVIDGSLDLGITGVETDHNSCICEAFYEDELVIAAPATEPYLQLKERDNFLDELFTYPIIIRESGSGTKKEADRFLESIGLSYVSLNVTARMNDLESIKKSIERGLGISIVSYKSIEDMVKSRKLICFHINEKKALRHFYIVYRKNHLLSNQLERFINFIKLSTKKVTE